MNYKQQGISLIEILVSILILSVGLLGLAAIQNTSLRLTYDSFIRTQASFIATDIMGRIRANQNSTPYSLSANSLMTKKDCFNMDNCTPNNMRQFDLYYWQENAHKLLPNATLELSYDSSNNSYSIILQWQDRQKHSDSDSDSDSDTTKFIYHFQVKK